jgi:hypothetical protein
MQRPSLNPSRFLLLPPSLPPYFSCFVSILSPSPSSPQRRQCSCIFNISLSFSLTSSLALPSPLWSAGRMVSAARRRLANIIRSFQRAQQPNDAQVSLIVACRSAGRSTGRCSCVVRTRAALFLYHRCCRIVHAIIVAVYPPVNDGGQQLVRAAICLYFS